MNKLCKSFLLCVLWLWCIVVSVPVLGATPGVPVSGSAVNKKGSGSLVLRNSIVWDNMFNSTDADDAASATNLIGTDPKFMSDTRFVLQTGSTANKKGDIAYNSLGKSIEGWSHTIDGIVSSGAFGTTVGVSVQTDGRVAVSLFISSSKDPDSRIIANEPVAYGTELYVVEGVALKDCSTPVLTLDNSPLSVLPLRMTGLHVVKASASLNPVVHYGVYETVSSGLTSHNNIFYDNQQLNCNFNPDATDLMTTDPKFVSDARFALSLASPALRKGNYTYNNLDKSVDGWEYYDNINSSGAFGTPIGITIQTDGNASVSLFTTSDANPDSEILSGQPLRYNTPLYIIEGTPSKGYQINQLILNRYGYSPLRRNGR
ncbi:MAG: hypothetical protein LBJ72_08615 [Dysgonamonadaceae bacterium]|nr:hypothetical protein [Dysgonamonadaceae bacterium]